MFSLINYGFNPLLFTKICTVVPSIDLLSMRERSHLLYSSSNILQMSTKVLCRAPGRKVCVWVHTFLLLLLGWGYYTHLVYKNQQATIFY